MSGDHDHGAGALRAGARHQRRLAMAFGLTLAFFVVEAVGGVLTNSLALLSDAGHMLTDVLGLGMALAAIQLASRFERREHVGQHTFGLYRLEILAAFVNALLLFGVAVYVLVEAGRRLFDEPEVLGLPMLLIACLGLLVNLVAFFLLKEGSKESINVEGAYLEVLADGLGSIGVIIAAVFLELFDWLWVDPVVGAAIGLWILPRTWRLGSKAVRILLQAAPPNLDLAAIERDLGDLPDVVDVHDLHVWTLTSDMENASVHLVVEVGVEAHGVLDQARDLLQRGYGIDHATLQIEPADHRGCDELTW
jgi:cobalt-zinc-cadmium efflux system protein